MNAIPLVLKRSIGVGIGLFILYIGLVNAGLIVRGNAARRPAAVPRTTPREAASPLSLRPMLLRSSACILSLISPLRYDPAVRHRSSG
jgi:xanthine/uracil/vitamin C permease (AzgA family)